MQYRWRQLTDPERAQLLDWRRSSQHPWHSPPHIDLDYPYFHLSAACYEHQPIIGTTIDRMQSFQETLLSTLRQQAKQIIAWCALPNHYHALIETEEIRHVLKDVGTMHGRLSHQWNGEDDQRGRKVWFNCADRAIRGERHFWATVNYIHHNPVHHGYVDQWQDWPFSSAATFLETMGREKAENIWRLYPILDYGKGWDDAKV